MHRILFIGERPSLTAARRGLRWEDGKLAAAQLFPALRAAGIEPDEESFTNLWRHAEPSTEDAGDEGIPIHCARSQATRGVTVVAMGEKVSAVLHRENIPHIRIVHPAARGKIRKRERYHAHIKETLGHLGRFCKHGAALVNDVACFACEAEWCEEARKRMAEHYGLRRIPSDRYKEQYRAGLDVSAGCQMLWDAFEARKGRA